MRRWLLVTAGFALAFAADRAGASVMRVRYSVHPFVKIAGSLWSGPGTGTLDLVYQASGSVPASSTGSGFSALPGPVQLLGGTLRATGFLPNPMAGPPAGLQVKMRLTLEPATGTLLPAGTLVLPMLPGLAHQTLHCMIWCYPLPFPPSVANPSTSSLVFAWSAPGHWTGTLDPAALTPHTFQFVTGPTITGGLRVIDASEVSRHFLPEPSALPSTLAGLALLAAARLRRGRVRFRERLR